MADSSEGTQKSDSPLPEFLSWLQQRPGAFINPKIEVVDLKANNVGRGVVAAADIDNDEELFSIQIGDVLSGQSSELERLCPDVFQCMDTWSSLILAMIYEDGLEAKSHWWPYLKILPTDFDTLIYWSSAELAELAGSAVLAKIGKLQAEESFVKILLPVVQSHSSIFGKYATAFRGPAARATLLQLAHRMATLIMACGFDLEDETPSEDFEEAAGSSQSAYELNKGMVPLADLLNADADLNNAHLIQNERTMSMVALKPIKKGEQIFNDYGPLPRSDLLRRYGYVTERYKKYDVVELSIDSIVASCKERRNLNEEEESQRLQLAAQWEVLQDGYDLPRPHDDKGFDFDDDLILTATAVLLDHDGYQRAADIDHVPSQTPEDLRLEVCHVLRSVIAKQTQAYLTTIAEDVALLERADLSHRRRMAIEVRLGEKEILALAAKELDKRIDKLNDTCGDLQAKEVKKRKL